MIYFSFFKVKIQRSIFQGYTLLLLLFVITIMPIFVAASHIIGLDTRSITRRSIKVGIWGGAGQAWAKAWALVTMMRLTHPMVAQPKLGTLWLQVSLCWTEPTGEPAGVMPLNYMIRKCKIAGKDKPPHVYDCPVSWGCRIHWLHLCRGVRSPPQRVSWIWH